MDRLGFGIDDLRPALDPDHPLAAELDVDLACLKCGQTEPACWDNHQKASE